MPEQSGYQRLGWIQNEIAELKENDEFRSLKMRESPHVSGKVQVDGKQLIDFGSNDYLSLSAHPQVVDIVKSNVGYVGWGSGASPLIHGRGTLHARLETEIARFEGTESALTFTSGYAANIGVIGSVVGKDDFVFSDAKNHASIIDGCRLSGASIQIYEHNDIDELKALLKKSGSARRRLIVTDGVFSMDGDLAKLREIVELANEFECMTLVDEAHSTGVFGETGKGVCEFLGVKNEIDIVVGTLSKAIGCHGGFVAGPQALIDWITNRARSYVFSTAVPDATCMAAVTALQLVDGLQGEREKLLETSAQLAGRLREMGIDTGNTQSQIIPVIVGHKDGSQVTEDNQRVLKFQQHLLEKGMFVPAIRSPSVPKGEAMLRISLNSSHSDEMIESLVAELGLLFENQN